MLRKINFKFPIFLYFCIFMLAVCAPAEDVVPVYANAMFLFFAFTSLVFVVINKWYLYDVKLNFVIFPVFILIVIISISHYKGLYLYDITTSWNDFSDYLKFILPVVIMYCSYNIFIKNDNNYEFYFFIFLSCFIYAIFFLLYLIWGESYIYNLGFGRGLEERYRYAGFVENPNRYAAIAFMLSAILFALLTKKNYFFYIPIILLMFLSVIFSQSRTTLIVMVSMFCLILVFLKVKLIYKIYFVVLVSIITMYIFNNYELYWLTTGDRFNVGSDRSFNQRILNSEDNLNYWVHAIGFFGIGPAKEVLSRLDTISYIMYYIRYGLLGVFSFIMIHFSIFFYFAFYAFKLKGIDSFSYKIIFINALVAIYVLFVNISNEKWIDPQFLTLWFVFIALGISKIKLSLSKRS